ncbi:MAG: hypothetical protein GTO02_13225 [Candidatus Dadabacteria bacterium]|nr:hypothetical protein [Candidatus Dadabacteria bacterium]
MPPEAAITAIAVHLHPFADTLELKDLIADKTAFKSKVKTQKAKSE